MSPRIVFMGFPYEIFSRMVVETVQIEKRVRTHWNNETLRNPVENHSALPCTGVVWSCPALARCGHEFAEAEDQTQQGDVSQLVPRRAYCLRDRCQRFLLYSQPSGASGDRRAITTLPYILTLSV